jgi:membrane protease YdiL (CAAX protease family)
MAVILILNRRQLFLKPIPERRDFKILILMVFLGGAGGLLLYLLWPLLGIPGTINMFLQQIGLTQAVWPYFIAYFILFNPWLEEFYWRGYLSRQSKRITLNDVLFSGYHLIVMAGKINTVWLIIVFVILILASWFWRLVNTRTQGLAPSLISHIVADASIIFTIYFMT